MKKGFFTLLTIYFSGLTFLGFSQQNENNISFIENKGQWQDNVEFMARIGGGKVWLHQNSFTFDFVNQEDFEKLHLAHHGKYKASATEVIRFHAYQLKFIGANENPTIQSNDPSTSYNNYYLGNDQSKWASNVKLYGELNYANLYPGIDMDIKTKNGYFSYDLIVKKGTDASILKWKYEGITPHIENNQIHLHTNAGDVIESVPDVYQMINGIKKQVQFTVKITNGEVSFNFPSGYDKNYDLVIDPTVIFSTYTGSTADNWGYTATYDSQANAIGGGVVFSTGFPISVGAYDNSFSGSAAVTDVALIKYSPNGSTRIFATYLGGSGSESPHSLIVDSQDNVIIYGTTSSSNFPTSAGCFDNSFNGGANVQMDGYINYTAGSDLFVTKLNALGTTLMASTFVGGTGNDGLNNVANLYYNYGDEARGEVIVDGSDNVIVASCTQSSNFPSTVGAQATTLQGGQDGVVFRLSASLGTMQFSTYLGGSNSDAAYGVKVNPVNNNIYACGGTKSSNFPATAGTIHPTFLGGSTPVDGFVTQLNTANGAMVTGTFLGGTTGSGYDQAYAIQMDADGDVYIMGQSTANYPVAGVVYNNANSTQFIHKMNAALNSTYFSTVIGSGTSTVINISPVAFLVDYCENIYISGWGGGTNSGYGNGSTTGMPTTAGAYDVSTDGSDFYCMVLERDAASLLYGTFFGGSGQEHVDGGTSRFDNNGTIYQAVCAGCGGASTFPSTPGVWSTTNQSTNCNLGLFKIEFNYQGIIADATAAPNIIACDPPYDVNFTGSTSGVTHYWDFDDGNTSTSMNPTHTFTAVGIYNVMYIAYDPSTCNGSDTAYLTVEILQAETFDAVFDIEPYDPCVSGTFDVNLEFTGSGADSLVWDMGDGNIYNDTIVNHTYIGQGTYIISMTAYDFTCNLSQTFIDTVSFNSTITTANANAAPNIIACDPPFIVNFVSGSGTPDNFWDFGDGVGTSTQANPSYTFTTIGNYNVMYVAIDSSTCNIADTVYLSVQILQSEDFSAEFSPIPPQICSDTVIVNISFTGTGADALTWDMGDGTIFTNDTVINYFYSVPGVYTLSLTAYDSTCNKTDTISQIITVSDNVIDGNVVIPNVFSPNGDGQNERFKLLYSNFPSIDAMSYLNVYTIEIYNRWGKKIFESDSPTNVWDGTIDGDAASEGVYYYIISYQRDCLDAEPVPVAGYLTLLRD